MHTYPCGPAPEIHILKVSGNLEVRGWERPEIGSDTPLPAALNREDDSLDLSLQGNISLRLPRDARLRIAQVAGNLSLRDLPEGVVLANVGGNLEIKRLGDVTVETVGGSLAVRRLDGDLRVAAVNGSAQVRDLSGDLTLERVQGELEARQVEGVVKVQVAGSADLRISFQPGATHSVHAAGEIVCRLEPDVSLALQMQSDAERIFLRLPDGSQSYRQQELDLTLGGGDGTLALHAGGTLHLSVRSDWGGESEEFADSLQAQMEALHQQVNAQLGQFSHLFGPLNAPLTPEQVARAQTRAAERAQERMQRAQEKLARKAENERRRAEMRAEVAQRRGAAGRRGAAWSAPADAAPAAASDEERLIILRMLEQKKITLQEAELLLSALEGSST